MSAIINNKFRTFNADNFISSIGTNGVYLLIGKADAWSGASRGEYIETSPSDTVIPVPIDTDLAASKHWDDAIAAKKIITSNVSHVIKRVNWTSGTAYDAYSDDVEDQIGKNFFVFSEPSFNVYKCIDNGSGGSAADNNFLSTVEPSGESTSLLPTADGYVWKFMFQVQQADVLKFVTTDWLPVNSPATSNQVDQLAVEQDTATKNGGLEYVRVNNGGTGYIDDNGNPTGATSNTITLAATASAVNGTYDGMSVYITSGTGSGQIRLISSYVGATKIATLTSAWETNPISTSVYSVAPTVTITSTSGNGSNATARVKTIVGGVIKKIAIVAEGNGYRLAAATITGGVGANAVVIPVISPIGGHGSNAVTELGGAYVMLNTRLIGNDGNDFPVNDDFRKVHLVVNPKLNGSETIASENTYSTSELQQDSGEIIYSEFRAPINRAPDSTEDIKLVVEF
jgi:hypothetical protein